MKKISLLLGTFLLAGCGMKYVTHNEIIQEYQGQNVEQLIGMWGAPQSTTPLPSGNVVYTFVSEKKTQEKVSELRSGSRSLDGKYGGTETMEVYQNVIKTCKTTVTANKKGKILNLGSSGEACEGRWVKKAEG